MLLLCNSLIRPHFEYAIQLLSPQYRKERYSQTRKSSTRAAKLIPDLRNKSYEDKLAELDMFSLEKRG